MAGPTKSELEQENERLRKEKELLQEQLIEKNAVLAESGEGGFLIKTQNEKYQGKTLGVQFVRGTGFVPASHPNAKELVSRLKTDYGYVVYESDASEYQETLDDVDEETDEGMSLKEIFLD